jgi:hypothetical protein
MTTPIIAVAMESVAAVGSILKGKIGIVVGAEVEYVYVMVPLAAVVVDIVVGMEAGTAIGAGGIGNFMRDKNIIITIWKAVLMLASALRLPQTMLMMPVAVRSPGRKDRCGGW